MQTHHRRGVSSAGLHKRGHRVVVEVHEVRPTQPEDPYELARGFALSPIAGGRDTEEFRGLRKLVVSLGESEVKLFDAALAHARHNIGYVSSNAPTGCEIRVDPQDSHL
jgi:hypothetical protein